MMDDRLNRRADILENIFYFTAQACMHNEINGLKGVFVTHAGLTKKTGESVWVSILNASQE